MKDETLICILFDLLALNKVTSAQLSAKYGISRRTVYRYLDSLSLAGVPIRVTYGADGGYSLHDNYRLPASFLSEKQYEATISALTAVNAELHNEHVAASIQKIIASRKGERSNFSLTSGNLIIDAGAWGDAGGHRAKLAVIERGIEERRALIIRYHDRNGEVSERIIEPHAVVVKQGLWYVLAFCRLRGDFRTFKTGRIETADLCAETFERKPLPEQPFAAWYGGSKTVEVMMRIDKNVLSDVEEWLGIENVHSDENGSYACVQLPDDDGLAMKIFAFGTGLEVIYPEKLRKKIAQAAKGLASLYEKN